jgi:serine/threonine protein phosphatase PrpC
VDKSLEFLILASDGLWDVVTNEVPKETLLKHFCSDLRDIYEVPISRYVFCRKLLPWSGL